MKIDCSVVSRGDPVLTMITAYLKYSMVCSTVFVSCSSFNEFGQVGKTQLRKYNKLLILKVRM